MAGHIGPHCEHVSPGCENCYSGTNNHRCLPSNGTGLPFDRRSRDLVEPFVDEKILIQPLSWRKPVKVFVENQSDLFGEWVTDEQIDRVFAVMALDYDMHWTPKEGNVRRPHHTWQVLTKRPERMLAYVKRIIEANRCSTENWFSLPLVRQAVDISKKRGDMLPGNASIPVVQWVADGMPGLWLGVSCENQDTADERIPLLLQTPAAVRFVSYEPALGPVNFRWARWDNHEPHARRAKQFPAVERDGRVIAGCVDHLDGLRMIDWVIVGGESGPGARPFDIAWARQAIEQCRIAKVACFIKQIGARPMSSNHSDWVGRRGFVGPTGNGIEERWFLRLDDRKGGDIEEFPFDLRVREFPEVSQLSEKRRA